MKKIKTILVTGAAKGIGYEVVRQLAAQGHRVLLAARDAAKGQAAADKAGAVFVPLDVNDDSQIQTSVQTVQQQYGGLDVLINNAAILLKTDGQLPHPSDNVYVQTIQTNAYAPLAMAKAFAPIMPAGSHIINVSSGGGSMTDLIGGWAPAYCISKSLLNAHTRHLAFWLAQQQIQVNALCPGWVQTDMGGSAAPRTVAQGADTIVWLATGGTTETAKFFRDRTVIPW
jgi:NAD(P)-dependent dehydrogenase (short-subunit alcohol dehydrogenase family)